MQYRIMPKTGDKISALGYGCMRFPVKRFGAIDEEKAIAQIRSAIDRGINYVDTAWPYHGGKSEELLAKALKDGYREKVLVADKLPQWLCKSPDDMNYYLDEQLKRLDIEQIDYYLIHSLNGSSWERAKEYGIIDFMNQALESGKIKHIGFSFHGLREDFKGIVDDYDWEFCQIQYNTLDKNFQAGIEGLEYAQSKGIGVIIMEPLRGGSLAGDLPKSVEKIYKKNNPDRSNVEWALRYVWNHPGVITVLSGMNIDEHIDENIRIASVAEPNSLSNEELETIEQAAEEFRSLMKVPCTACQYCMPCPANVDIPSAFSFYNNKYLFKAGLYNRLFYLLQNSGAENKKASFASQCVDCGKCVEHCPQSIDIPTEIKKVSKEFEGIMKKPLLFMLKANMSRGARKRDD